jgi:WD40 repeat protein
MAAVTGNYKTATVWDLGTGRELAQLTGHLDNIKSLEFSPDGQRVS